MALTLREAKALLAIPDDDMLPPNSIWYDDVQGKG